MMCSICGLMPAKARGLCKGCYQRERKAGRIGQYSAPAVAAKASKRNVCKVDGCDKPAYGQGYCRSHYERWKRGTLTMRLVPDLPGEQWADIDGHGGWMVSTDGRVKSSRTGHEKLLKPRMVDGRLLIHDHDKRNGVTVHRAVLDAFRPGVDGRPKIIDGDPANCKLENLQWETIDTRRAAATIMAEQSQSRWGTAFAAYWSGDNHALDQFFEEMRRFLIVMIPRKLCTWSVGYQLDVDDIIHTTLVKVFFSIHSATITSLDKITSYVCTVADRILAGHWKYARGLVPLTVDGKDGEDVNLLDVAGWHHPSAELEAILREHNQQNEVAAG